MGGVYPPRDLVSRGQSRSIPAFGFFDERVQELAEHTSGRPKVQWGWIDQLGEDDSPKWREHYATNHGRGMLRAWREILQHGA